MIDLQQLMDTFGSGGLALWGPFGVLILCGLGLPIPEDIVLITSGYLSAEQGTSFLVTAIVMYFGILLGDGIVYYAGRFIGTRLIKTRLGSLILTPERLSKAMKLFHKYGTGVVFIGRFLPGLRTPIFFCSGSLHFPAYRFFGVDGFAALISAPVFVWLGHWAQRRYGDDVQHLQNTLGKTQLTIVGCGLVLGLFIFSYLWKRSKKHTSSAT